MQPAAARPSQATKEKMRSSPNCPSMAAPHHHQAFLSARPPARRGMLWHICHFLQSNPQGGGARPGHATCQPCRLAICLWCMCGSCDTWRSRRRLIGHERRGALSWSFDSDTLAASMSSSHANPGADAAAYLYLAMNLSWNFDSDKMATSMSSSDGRNVVRKWLVPSSWPNPLPGTTTMPVSTSRSWQ